MLDVTRKCAIALDDAFLRRQYLALNVTPAGEVDADFHLVRVTLVDQHAVRDVIEVAEAHIDRVTRTITMLTGRGQV